MFRRTKTQALLLVFLFLASLLAVQFAFAQTSTPAPSSAPTPTMLWQFTSYNYPGPGKFSISQWSTPTIVDGVVYVDMIGSRNYDKAVPVEGLPGATHNINVDESWGGVYALNATTGKLVCFGTTQGSNLSPSVGDGMVFAQIADNEIGAFNNSNGRSLWNFTSGGSTHFVADAGGVSQSVTVYFGVGSSPTFADDKVFVGWTDGNVYALNASSGSKIWTFTTDTSRISHPALYSIGNEVRSAPTVVNGVVYVGSDNGYLYALNASSGYKIWSYGANSSIGSIPAVVNDKVYFSAYDRYIYSLNITDGTKEWNYTCGNEWDNTPNFDAAFVYLSSMVIKNGVVYFNYNGVVGWKDGSYKYFGTVCALNALSGAKLWNNTMNSYTSDAPTVQDGVVYVFSNDQNLYALNAGTGETISKYYIGKSIDTSKIDNGVAYYGPGKDVLYALKLPPESTPLPSPTSTIPEFSWLMILPLFLSLVSILVLITKRKVSDDYD